MLKKTCEKEAYLAPEWGMRVVYVERHYLAGSDGDPDGGTPGGDEGYGDQGNF